VNFDRHGAWLSMGNIQLHLIKGMPHTHRGQHPADLIVSHIALEVPDVEATLQKLRCLQKDKFPGLRWRQNVSVPTWETSRADHFETDHTSSKGKLTQFFLEDPDGHWLEICNCGEHEAEVHNPEFWVSAKMKVRMLAWVSRARLRLSNARPDETVGLKAGTLEDVDREKLYNFCMRRNSYGDICQGFSDDELCTALAQAGNHVPCAILSLKRARVESGQIFHPPSFLDEVGKVCPTERFRMPSKGRSTDWGSSKGALDTELGNRKKRQCEPEQRETGLGCLVRRRVRSRFVRAVEGPACLA